MLLVVFGSTGGSHCWVVPVSALPAMGGGVADGGLVMVVWWLDVSVDGLGWRGDVWI